MISEDIREILLYLKPMKHIVEAQITVWVSGTAFTQDEIVRI